MADRLAWLADYADTLLHQPPPDYSPSPTDPPTSPQPRQLAVLLLWLDCLSFIANSTPHPTPASFDSSSPDQLAAGAREHEEGPTRPPARPEGSSAPPSQSDNLDEFVAYLAQVVSAPSSLYRLRASGMRFHLS